MFNVRESVDVNGRSGSRSQTALLPPIIQVVLVDHQIFIVMVMIEVDIGIRPDKFLHKTMAN